MTSRRLRALYESIATWTLTLAFFCAVGVALTADPGKDAYSIGEFVSILAPFVLAAIGAIALWLAKRVP